MNNQQPPVATAYAVAQPVAAVAQVQPVVAAPMAVATESKMTTTTTTTTTSNIANIAYAAQAGIPVAQAMPSAPPMAQLADQYSGFQAQGIEESKPSAKEAGDEATAIPVAVDANFFSPQELQALQAVPVPQDTFNLVSSRAEEWLAFRNKDRTCLFETISYLWLGRFANYK